MREACTFLLTLGFVTAIALLFPVGALRFVPADDARPAEPSCAFVTLTDGERAEALAAAHSAWHVDVDSARRMRVDMEVGELPETRMPAVLAAPTPETALGRGVSYGGLPLPPSMAAGAPVRLPADRSGTDVRPAFGRDELLQLDATTRKEKDR